MTKPSGRAFVSRTLAWPSRRKLVISFEDASASALFNMAEMGWPIAAGESCHRLNQEGLAFLMAKGGASLVSTQQVAGRSAICEMAARVDEGEPA